MLTGRISGATCTLLPPTDWDAKKFGPCSGLAIRVEDTGVGRGMTSAWFPNADEIARIAAGAPIYLTVLGNAHPPVALAVGEASEA